MKGEICVRAIVTIYPNFGLLLISRGPSENIATLAFFSRYLVLYGQRQLVSLSYYTCG